MCPLFGKSFLFSIVYDVAISLWVVYSIFPLLIVSYSLVTRFKTLLFTLDIDLLTSFCFAIYLLRFFNFYAVAFSFACDWSMEIVLASWKSLIILWISLRFVLVLNKLSSIFTSVVGKELFSFVCIISLLMDIRLIFFPVSFLLRYRLSFFYSLLTYLDCL